MALPFLFPFLGKKKGQQNGIFMTIFIVSSWANKACNGETHMHPWGSLPMIYSFTYMLGIKGLTIVTITLFFYVYWACVSASSP